MASICVSGRLLAREHAANQLHALGRVERDAGELVGARLGDRGQPGLDCWHRGADREELSRPQLH